MGMSMLRELSISQSCNAGQQHQQGCWLCSAPACHDHAPLAASACWCALMSTVWPQETSFILSDRSPYLCQLIGAHLEDSNIYLVLELLQGDLYSALASSELAPMLTWRERCELGDV